MNFRETQRISKLDIDSLKINITAIVQVFYEKVLEDSHSNASIT